MDDMVTRVVEVLDEVGMCKRNDQHYRTIKLNELSPDLLGRYKKKAGAQSSAVAKAGDHEKSHKRFKGITKATNKQFAHDTKPSKTTGERGDYEKEKEKQRKEMKRLHPNSSLKWSKNRWVIRKQQKEEIMETLSSLQEISLRTGFIGGFLLKVKQYGNKVDQDVSKLKSLSSSLNTTKDDKERIKIQSEIVKTDSEVSHSLKKMIMYVGLVSGSGGLGGDRTYKLLKKLEKQIKK